MHAWKTAASTAARRDHLAALAIAAELFAMYATGAARTIYVGDSGNLATAVSVLGVPHGESPSPFSLPLCLCASVVKSCICAACCRTCASSTAPICAARWPGGCSPISARR
jgi:hypothetical protein